MESFEEQSKKLIEELLKKSIENLTLANTDSSVNIEAIKTKRRDLNDQKKLEEEKVIGNESRIKNAYELLEVLENL